MAKANNGSDGKVFMSMFEDEEVTSTLMADFTQFALMIPAALHKPVRKVPLPSPTKIVGNNALSEPPIYGVHALFVCVKCHNAHSSRTDVDLRTP